ncbi:MAG TPA: membrane dipeptidase [Leptolinea sp.]
MPYLIDAHEDLAWDWLCFGTDYSRSLNEIRTTESGEIEEHRGGGTLFGWSEYSRGQVALIFGTYFIAPKKYAGGNWDRAVFSNARDYASLIKESAEYYHRLADRYPEKFRRVFSKHDLAAVLQPWKKEVAPSQPPMGILNLIEGSEGLGSLAELEEWWQLGARILGPVWAGTRFCGGTHEGKGFTKEGHQLLSALADIGYILDVSHMNDQSASTALDEFAGTVIASHANCRWLLKNPENQRQLSQDNVRRLVERGGVIGVLPYARFLRTDWTPADPDYQASLEDLADHVDAICQTAGSVDHVAIGTDFDGGFGWPNVPVEVNSIADMQKLAPILQNRGYTSAQVEAVFHGNWERILNQALPES